MASESVESEFRKSVAAQIRLVAEGANRYRLSTPFIFDDGDHPIIILKREDAKWVLSDDGSHPHALRRRPSRLKTVIAAFAAVWP